MNRADDIEDRSEFRAEPEPRDDADDWLDQMIDRIAESRPIAPQAPAKSTWLKRIRAMAAAEVTDARVDGADSCWMPS